MTPQPAPEANAPRTWKLILPVAVFAIMVFFFAFDAGKFYMDRLQKIDTRFSIGMSFAGFWTIGTVLKHKKSARSRVVTLAAISALQIVPMVAGFRVGKDAQYPAESRALVQNIQEHARQIKSIKEHIGQMRQSFTDPAQLLSLQPLIVSWKENVDKISEVNKNIRHDELPSFIAEVLKIMNDALIFDRRQVQNINEQISILQSSKDLGASEKAQIYKNRLEPLMEKEEEIERQRQSANLEQRIKNVPKKTGY